MSNSKENRIKELIKILNEASKAYYAEDKEIMDNFTYDKLYDELCALEEETGLYFSDSPTQNVGYESVDELPKVAHEKPMLSLDKTKDVEVLRAFIGSNKTLISWKMDGLTMVLTYRDGKLFQAVTRGDGRVGEDVTNNAKVFKGLPLTIPFKGELILRGEAYITYDDFEMINLQIEDVESKYKNPRNLCSGSVRQLNNEVTAKRNVRCKIFSLVKADNAPIDNSNDKAFRWLLGMGFDVVEYRVITADELDDAYEYFKEAVKTNPFPSDGLVALYDDIAYGESLGTTAKFPRNSFAFKWADEQRNTHLIEIEWSPSRTGLINPVAIFEPVELEGTTVSRASVHNVSILKELKLGFGDEILVYKANMIIPQIAENLTKSSTVTPPDTCPACGASTYINNENSVETLYCSNPDCPAKQIKSFSLFAGRDAINIDGMSEATLEKFIAHGFIKNFTDLFRLNEHKDAIVSLEGFGEKSYNKLLAACNNAKKTTLAKLLGGLGIPNIGTAAGRLIANYFDNDPKKVAEASEEELVEIDGIGEVIAKEYVKYFSDENKRRVYDELTCILEFENNKADNSESKINGKTFVVTGSLNVYANRNALKEFIENSGGKVAGSVSKKTDYLINNDTTSNSSKNKTAKELNIPIISEDDFIEKFTK